MKLLLLLLVWTSLAVQATGVKLQRGMLDKGLVAEIARLPKMWSQYNTWEEKENWLQNPHTYPELAKLLTQLGVSGEAFMQAIIEFSEIYPVVWSWSNTPRMDKYSDSESVLPHYHIMRELAIDYGKKDNENLVLFTRLLEEPQTLLGKATRRITLMTDIAARDHDPIYESEYGSRILNFANRLRANKIGLSWDTYVRIINDDEVSLADFVYMRYAVGEDKQANALFNDLLAGVGLSRTDFDAFFAANKHNYADLNKRKDIMERILSAVLPSASDEADLAHEIYAKVGLHASTYVAYVYAGADLGTWSLLSLEKHIGAEKSLHTPLNELLADNGVPRDKFEQALADVFSIYSVWWPYNHSNRAMTRSDLLYQVGGLGTAAGYFNALISNKTSVYATPEQVRRRSAILKKMFDKTSSEKYIYNRLREIGIIDNYSRLFFFLQAKGEADNKILVEGRTGNKGYYSTYLDDLVNMHYAVGKNQQLDALFNDLLAEYDLNRTDFDALFAANKDEPVGYYFGDGIGFRKELQARAEAFPTQ